VVVVVVEAGALESSSVHPATARPRNVSPAAPAPARTMNPRRLSSLQVAGCSAVVPGSAGALVWSLIGCPLPPVGVLDVARFSEILGVLDDEVEPRSPVGAR
jgi:hypothetical protein